MLVPLFTRYRYSDHAVINENLQYLHEALTRAEPPQRSQLSLYLEEMMANLKNPTERDPLPNFDQVFE